MDENFEFKSLIGVGRLPFGGYVSALDKTVASPTVLTFGSKNTYLTRANTIANRPGLKRRGVANTAGDGVASSFEWYTSLNATRVLRVLSPTSAGGDGKLQLESNILDGETYQWYDLLTSLSLTRFVFDSWYDTDEAKDRLIMVNGDSVLKHWSGGISLANLSTPATLKKSDSSTTWAQDGFATHTSGEKKFTIVGSSTVYTYSAGEDSDTLNGITPNLPAITTDTVIIQTVQLASDKPAAGFNTDFIKVIGNRVHAGSYASRLIYISDQDDFTNYTVPTPRLAGDPELLTLDDTAKGISVRQGNAAIAAGLSTWYEVSYSQVTVGAVLTEATKVDKRPISDLSAPLAHEFIDTVGDSIVFLDQSQQVRIIGNFKNLFTTKYPSISQDIYTELRATDFTGGHLRAVGDNIYLTAPVPGKVYIHQTREKLNSDGGVTAQKIWFPPFYWNLSRIAVIDGVEYGHSNQNPQIYQMWNTGQFHDDSPTDEPVPYDSSMRLAYINPRRQGLVNFDKSYYEGYCVFNGDLKARIYYDYEGSTAIDDLVINSAEDPATLFTAAGRFGLGGEKIGDTPEGGGMTPNDGDQHLPKFRTILDRDLFDVFEFEMEVHSEEADSQWEIICLGVNFKVASEQATFIRK